MGLKWLMDANTPTQKTSRCITVFLTLLAIVVVLASPAPARFVLQIHRDDTAVGSLCIVLRLPL
jgi:hypothetical protein